MLLCIKGKAMNTLAHLLQGKHSFTHNPQTFHYSPLSATGPGKRGKIITFVHNQFPPLFAKHLRFAVQMSSKYHAQKNGVHYRSVS